MAARSLVGECTIVWAGTEWRYRLDMAPIEPVDVAGWELSILESRIESSSRRKKVYPATLDDLGPVFLVGRSRADAMQFLDPWGHRYWYQRLDVGHVLFSNGPDGVPGTADDILPGGTSERCSPPGEWAYLIREHGMAELMWCSADVHASWEHAMCLSPGSAWRAIFNRAYLERLRMTDFDVLMCLDSDGSTGSGIKERKMQERQLRR